MLPSPPIVYPAARALNRPVCLLRRRRRKKGRGRLTRIAGVRSLRGLASPGQPLEDDLDRRAAFLRLARRDAFAHPPNLRGERQSPCFHRSCPHPWPLQPGSCSRPACHSWSASARRGPALASSGRRAPRPRGEACEPDGGGERWALRLLGHVAYGATSILDLLCRRVRGAGDWSLVNLHASSCWNLHALKRGLELCRLDERAPGERDDEARLVAVELYLLARVFVARGGELRA